MSPFASLGGLWDVLFNSRHHGRSDAECAATRDDNYRIERKLKPSRAKGMGWDHPLITPQPLLAYFPDGALRDARLDAPLRDSLARALRRRDAPAPEHRRASSRRIILEPRVVGGNDDTPQGSSRGLGNSDCATHKQILSNPATRATRR